MDKLKALGRGTQIMFIAAVLLLIVSFFHWQQVDFGPVSAGQNALHGFFGWVMFLLTIVLIARIAARLAAVDVPIPLSFATTSFVLGILIAICAVLKVLTDDYRHFWGFVGAALAIVVAVGAWLEVQEAGGIESLKQDASNLSTSVGSAAGSGSATQETGAPPADAPAAQEAASEAAAGASDVAGDAQGAASEAADAASDATSDTPSNEQGA